MYSNASAKVSDHSPAYRSRYAGTVTMGNPKYPLELFRQAVTVGLKTIKVVGGLPKLDIK